MGVFNLTLKDPYLYIRIFCRYHDLRNNLKYPSFYFRYLLVLVFSFGKTECKRSDPVTLHKPYTARSTAKTDATKNNYYKTIAGRLKPCFDGFSIRKFSYNIYFATLTRPAVSPTQAFPSLSTSMLYGSLSPCFPISRYCRNWPSLPRMCTRSLWQSMMRT